ncbi:MAG: hypothetical protein ABSE62_00510 [Chthoniobacteraceae bacterium]|jgi:hypothetical protein
MIYGTPPVKLETDVTDVIGIRTLVLGQMWQPSASNLSQEQIDAESPDIPGVPGGLILVGQQCRPFGGCYKTTWTFEGILGDGKSVTFKDRTNSLDYGFDPGFAQVPIQTHPYFQDMLTQFGGYPDPSSSTVIWPTTMPAASASGGGSTGMPGGSSAGSATPNPMFGRQDYFSLDGQYYMRYALLTKPTGYSNINLIVDTSELPGDPPSDLPSDRNWLVVPPTYKRRGLIFEVMETYWLSYEGGWNIPSYTKPSGQGTWSIPTS